jgi:hypothetical protein
MTTLILSGLNGVCLSVPKSLGVVMEVEIEVSIPNVNCAWLDLALIGGDIADGHPDNLSAHVEMDVLGLENLIGILTTTKLSLERMRK